MKNTILTLLSTLMVLLAFSSCDETELIDPVDQRTTLNLGAGDGTVDNDGVTSNVDGEEAVGVRTTIGGNSLFDIKVDPVDDVNIRTVDGNGGTLANQIVDANDEVRSNYDNDGDNQALTHDPIDAVDTRTSDGYNRVNWDNTIVKEEDTQISTYGSTGTDDRTPVMPDNIEAKTRRSVRK